MVGEVKGRAPDCGSDAAGSSPVIHPNSQNHLQNQQKTLITSSVDHGLITNQQTRSVFGGLRLFVQSVSGSGLEPRRTPRSDSMGVMTESAAPRRGARTSYEELATADAEYVKRPVFRLRRAPSTCFMGPL